MAYNGAAPEQAAQTMREDRQPAAGETDPPLYTSDEFRIYYMKVLPCSKRYCHDWTTCPFAHPGEKARRRDPRVSSYTGIACPDMKKDGVCVRGELCPYAHNVFEYWLHPTRYRTQLCNDGTNCKRRVCFFAHTLSELRVPSSKPFVNPQALAAAAAAVGARRTSFSNDQCDLARLRGGHGVGDPGAAADLARRLASLSVGQQLAAQQQASSAQLQQQAQAHSDQNTVLMQLLATLLAQKEAAQQQQPPPLPAGLEGQVPSSEALAALYQQLAGGRPQGAPPADVGYGQQDQAALLAALHDPSGVYAQQLLGGKDGAHAAGGPQHPTPRSSLDLMAALGRSAYSSPRSSFEVPQGLQSRSSFDVNAYTSRSSLDSSHLTRSSFESGSSRPSGSMRASSFLQDCPEGEAAHHGGLNADAAAFDAAPGSAPMAFGPGGAYFLSGAAAQGPYGGGYGADNSAAANQRSASLPAYLPKAFSAAPFAATMPGLQEGVAYSGEGQQHNDVGARRRGSCEFHGAIGSKLPPKPPASRRFSMDSTARAQGANDGYPHHLIGALPGSFNYATLSDSATARGAAGSPNFTASQSEFAYGGLHLGGSQAFAGQDLISNGFARTSGSSASSEPAGSSSLFANAPPTTRAEQQRSSSLGGLYESTHVSRPASGHGSGGGGSPHHNIWSPQPQP